MPEATKVRTDVTPHEAIAVLKKVAEKGELPPDVREEMSLLAKNTRPQVQTTLETSKLSVEQADLLETLEGQHPAMQKALERVKISTAGMPSWEAVKAGLTPEVVEKALKMQEPTLIMVPPTTRQSKVDAIDKHPAEGQKNNTYTYELRSNDLWNGGNAKTENRWRVVIVEGAEDVMSDPEITDGKKTNYQMAKAYVEKYADQGLNVINDADTYLSLMLKALAEGKPVDSRTLTVLNAKNATETSSLAGGEWSGARVSLGGAIHDVSYGGLRVRSLVGVDVQA